MKKIIACIMALVMCLCLCSVAYAANGDISITATSDNVPFANAVSHVASSGVEYDAYYCYAELPDRVNSSDFASVPVSITVTGTGLKINGVSKALNNGVYTGTVDFRDAVSMEVIYSGGSKTYYVYAYPSEFTVNMTIDYSNAETFSQLSENAIYGTFDDLDPVSLGQLAAAESAVSSMNTMCSSMTGSGISLSDYKTMSDIPVDSAYTPYEVLNYFAAHRTNFSYVGDQYYIESIGALNMFSTGTAYDGGVYTGGWMYQVQRNGVTCTPLIGINGWKLFPGDTIIWRYTCDLGYDIGSPMW